VTLLAEDLLLLLLDDESGKFLLDGLRLDRVLAGALLLDLVLAERVSSPTPERRFGQDRLVIENRTPLGDPLLDEALTRLDGRRPPAAARAVEKWVKGTRQAVLTRIVEAGLVRAEHRTVLGLFPVSRWPAVRPEHEAAVRRELHGVLLEGRDPTPRIAAVVALLLAVDVLPKVVPGSDRRALVRRAKEVAEGDWAATAVRKAVDAIRAGIIAAGVAATTAAASS
jgi:hypothetical protein